MSSNLIDKSSAVGAIIATAVFAVIFCFGTGVISYGEGRKTGFDESEAIHSKINAERSAREIERKVVRLEARLSVLEEGC